MNQKDVDRQNSHRLIIIGSARGVNRFYVTNKFIEKYPHAKVINTGVLITSLTKQLNLPSLDTISIVEYYRILEPAFISNILAHLEHTDVILDTHFYHRIPCLGIKSLRTFIGKISQAFIVLVEEDPLKIYTQKRERGDTWFDNFENVKDDVAANKEYFEVYEHFFSKFTQTHTLAIDLASEGLSKVDEFVQGLIA